MVKKKKIDIALPEVYTILTACSQNPRPDTALKWSHLESVASYSITYRSDVDVSLLIDINCTRAIKPLIVVPGKNDEPYGVEIAVGWGVVGILSPNAYIEDTRTKEVMTPQQINRMFELDLNDTKIEKKMLFKSFTSQVAHGAGAYLWVL